MLGIRNRSWRCVETTLGMVFFDVLIMLEIKMLGKVCFRCPGNVENEDVERHTLPMPCWQCIKNRTSNVVLLTLFPMSRSALKNELWTYLKPMLLFLCIGNSPTCCSEWVKVLISQCKIFYHSYSHIDVDRSLSACISNINWYKSIVDRCK